jgi:DNA replication protein DnaC
MTQRWTPEDLLRTLVEAEITTRDASNARTRMKTAAFPVIKTIDEFDHSVSSIPTATLDYLGSLEWIDARENLCLVGPAGTGKSHYADLRVMPMWSWKPLPRRVIGLGRSA